MIAIIFAAGIGSRLKPFTDHHPKAIAPVAGVPAIVRTARRLVNAGARKIIVNVHHFPQQVIDCMMAQDFCNIVEFSDESDLLLDTGGAIAKIYRQGLLDDVTENEPIIVHNADIVTTLDLGEFLEAHSGEHISILVDPDRHSTRHLLFDSELILRGWENIQTGATKPEKLDTSGLTPAAFGGVHIIDKETAQHISESAPEHLSPFSIIDWYINNCSKTDINAYVQPTPYLWHDIGTTEKLGAANAAFSEQ